MSIEALFDGMFFMMVVITPMLFLAALGELVVAVIDHHDIKGK